MPLISTNSIICTITLQILYCPSVYNIKKTNLSKNESLQVEDESKFQNFRVLEKGQNVFDVDLIKCENPDFLVLFIINLGAF